MAAYAARRLLEMARNCGRIVAIELLAAAQGLDLRRPLATSPALGAVMTELRARAAFLDRDRPLAPDIAQVHALVEGGWFLRRIWPDEADQPFLAKANELDARQ
jgi:histidine ammonia-lyase